ncbi:S8 family serine peptidase [Paenibacillus athensensis]|uniref:SLH domain-containing protein n=1 Tax=Paenibacillus athensensis TaxID=1967502 RepID=A0A4Y8Q8Z8_9BACL|nr:S8 family serine peptidase [Paenibacillus athensensis]MCD1260162.1 S8 family serine peptidase [Paenibacillus athensensis]
MVHKKMYAGILAGLVLGAGLLLPARGYAAETGPQAEASAAAPTATKDVVPGKVLVKYKPSAHSGSLTLQARSAAPADWTTLSFNPATAVADKMAELQSDPDVAYVEPVYKIHLSAAAPQPAISGTLYDGDESYMKTWGKAAADLNNLGDFSTVQHNQQVTVAVIDTGVDLSHPDLVDAIVPGYDFVNNDTVAQDDNGHGTHVAGIVGANTVTGTVYGVAPGVKIMPLKVLDQDGYGDTALLIQALQYAMDHHADVVNMSLGSLVDSRALHDVIKTAYSQHIVMVAAAGNDSNHWIQNEPGQMDNPAQDTQRYAKLATYPAAYEEVISVGAVAQLPDSSYAIADFSNVGKVDVVAPGVQIDSTKLGGGYTYMSGTSMASPFVAGLSALLKANNAALDDDDIATILRTSVKPAFLHDTEQFDYVNFTEYPNNAVSPAMAYGSGLIQGLRAFQLPRLKMTRASVNFPTYQDVTYQFTMLDVHDSVVNATYGVSLEARHYEELAISRESDTSYSYGSFYNGSLVNGQVQLTTTISSNNPVYYFYVFGSWVETGEGGKTYVHRSNIETFLNRPVVPSVSLPSGEYSGAQNVTITSPYLEGEVYYRLQDASGTSYGKFTMMGGSLRISKSSVLTVATRNNSVFSEDAVYQYTIQTPASGGWGGGGGGGGGGSTQTPPTLTNGKMVYALTPARIDLLIDLNKDTKELTLDATTKEKLDVLTIEFDADVIAKAASRNKSIVIKGNDVSLQIPPNALPVKDESVPFRFQSTLKAAPGMSGYQAASPVYDFSFTVDGAPVTQFNQPIQATFTYDKSKVKDPAHLGVYVLDEQTGAWTSVGGTLNSNGTISAKLPHFSQYAVLETRADDQTQPAHDPRTFSDIQQHWAQKEIESLVAQHIVDGFDAASFQPDASMTRAQFVTLLTKAFHLERHGSATGFTDVADDAWYREAVYAAYEANIVSGVSEKEFAPSASITREQMAVMMVNAYLYATGKKLSDLIVTDEVKFSDEGAVSSWARTSVRIASGLGLIHGTPTGGFEPSSICTRAQAAVVISRMLDTLKK